MLLAGMFDYRISIIEQEIISRHAAHEVCLMTSNLIKSLEFALFSLSFTLG